MILKIAKKVRPVLLFIFILLALDVALTRFILADFIIARLGPNKFVRTYSSVYNHGFKPNRMPSGATASTALPPTPWE